MEDFNKKDRQLDNLINLVEKHTRTERHLEQYSHIGDEENKDHARRIQDVREEQIDDLKNKLNGKDNIQGPSEQLENIEQKYESTKSYIENNKNSINNEMLKNMENKQDNRKNQINNLKNS